MARVGLLLLLLALVAVPACTGDCMLNADCLMDAGAVPCGTCATWADGGCVDRYQPRCREHECITICV